MRAFLGSLALVLLCQAAAADTYVRGYTRSDGTYVQPHYRSDPDGDPFNNYSSRGNTNPYTGQRGTVDPFKAPSKPYGTSPYGSTSPFGYGSKQRW
jgi:hypothetical protein